MRGHSRQHLRGARLVLKMLIHARWICGGGKLASVMKIKSFFLIRFSRWSLVELEPTNKTKKFLPSWESRGNLLRPVFLFISSEFMTRCLQGMFLCIIQTVCFPIPWSALLEQAWADDRQPCVLTSEVSTRSVYVGITPGLGVWLATTAAGLVRDCLRVDTSSTSPRKGNLRRPRAERRLLFAYTSPVFIVFCRLPSRPAFLSLSRSSVCLSLCGYRVG